MTLDDRILIGAIAICTCIGFLFFSLFDFFIYNMYRDNYVNTKVVIESISHNGNGCLERVNFEVVIDGITYKGDARRNLWEKPGDTIEVAYNTQHEFIRTQINCGKLEIILFLLFIASIFKYLGECRRNHNL